MLLVNCIWLHMTYSVWVKNTCYAVRMIFYSFHYKWLSDCPLLGKRLVYFGNMKTVWSKVLCYRPWLCAVLCFLSQWENNLGLNSAGLDFCHHLHWIAEPLSELLSFLPPLISQQTSPSSPARQRAVDSGLHCDEVSNTQSIWQHSFMKRWLLKLSRPFSPLTNGHNFSPFTKWLASHKCWLRGWCR